MNRKLTDTELEIAAKKMILLRWDNYGDPINMLCKIANKWTDILPIDLNYSFTAADVAKMMALLKQCRLSFKPSTDSQIDKRSYEILESICMDKYKDDAFIEQLRKRLDS